jgi:uncharacterized protein (DUF2236 family)
VPTRSGSGPDSTATARLGPGDAGSAEPLGPDSLIWRTGLSRLSLLLAGRALLLQVAHPAVGAGVRDFSNFRADPWGRLDHTVTSLLAQLFGGPEAVAEAARLRRMHRGIAGTGFDGAPYRALDEEAWAWVHVVNGDSVLMFVDRFATPFGAADRERFWTEWRQVGAVLGIPGSAMPADVAGLRATVDGAAATVLGDNPTVRVLLDTLRLRAVPSPARLLPGPVWRALAPLGAGLLHDTTLGTTPPALRARLGVTWSPADERRLERIATAARTTGPLLPDRILHYPAATRARRAAAAW